MCLLIFGLASAAMSAAGSIASGMAAKNQADAQAQAYRNQANTVRDQGAYEAQRQNEQAQAAMGQGINIANASGFTLEGSPSDVLTTNASNAALDQGQILWNSKKQASDLNYQAQLSEIQGKNAMTGAMIGAAGSALGGLAGVAKDGGFDGWTNKSASSSPAPAANSNATFLGVNPYQRWNVRPRQNNYGW